MTKKLMNLLFYLIFAFYIFIMIDLFFRFSYIFEQGREITRSYNLVPLRTIWAYISGQNRVPRGFIINNTLGNIAVYLPVGLYVEAIGKRKSFGKSLLIVLLTSVAVELIQYAFGLGASDIDDVLLNTCGGVLGMLLYRLLRRLFREEGRTRMAVTVLSALVGIPVIVLYFSTVFGHLRL